MYRNTLLALAALLWLTPPAAAQEPYRVDDINPILRLLDADVIVRLESLHFDIADAGRATERVRRVVTVFNREGQEAGLLVVPYDGIRKIKSLQGLMRDANGKVIRRLKKRDFSDYSAIDGNSLYDDARVMVGELYDTSYPYTVDYTYEVEHDGLTHWPTWSPQRFGMAVEQARFVLEAPEDLGVRYALEGIAGEPVSTIERGRHQLWWDLSLLMPFEPEPWGPDLQEQIPTIYTAGNRFEVEGSKGDMATWQGFGQWYNALNAGRDKLPPAAQAEVLRVIQEATTDREKAALLYDYMQARTRYISIQLGIGGYQTFDAIYVNERGYGDCKALVNYMYALLKVAEVEAYPALIRAGAGERDILADFPCNQFNHVILYLPLDGNPEWLECTSQITPFGHLGSFTEDRYALVIKPEGGELMRTPRSDAFDNEQRRHGTITLDALGNAVAEVQTTYTGNQQDRVRMALAQASGLDRDRWLRGRLDLPSFEILAADFTGIDADEPTVTIPVKLELPRYGSKTGKRIFLRPNLLERWVSVPDAVENRTQPVAITYAYADTDSLRFVLPTGYGVEDMPRPVDIETPFATYRAAIVEADGELRYTRQLAFTEKRIPAEDYEAFRDFMRQVAKADKVQVALVQRTEP